MPNVRPINLDITLENKIKLWARFMHRYRPIVYLALTTSSSSHFVFYSLSFLFFSLFIYPFSSSFISYLELLFIYFFLLLRAASDVFSSCFWDFHFFFCLPLLTIFLFPSTFLSSLSSSSSSTLLPLLAFFTKMYYRALTRTQTLIREISQNKSLYNPF